MNIKQLLYSFAANYREDMLLAARKLLTTALIIIAARVIVSIVKKMINRAVKGRLKFDATIAAMLKAAVAYGAVIISVIMILDVFGVNTASLIAMLGAAGVAVGLALKDTLSNIAAGLVLILQGSCRKGDFVEFAGLSGTVQEISLFTVILKTADGVFVSAPNSAVWGTPLKNYSRNASRRMDLAVGISYDDSIDAAFALLREIAVSEKRFLPDPAPQILVQSLGDSAVNLVLRAWADNSVYWQLYWDQTKNIKEKIDKAGLHIPFPQVDVNVKKA